MQFFGKDATKFGRNKDIDLVMLAGDKDYPAHAHIKFGRFSQQKEIMKLVVENKFEKPEDILSFLITFCSRISKLFGNEVRLKTNIEEAA